MKQQKANTQQEYNASNKLVKRNVRNDQRQWVNDCAQRADEAARNGDSKHIF